MTLRAPHLIAARTAVVADSDAFARRAIVDVLERADVSVVAETADGATAVELVRRHAPSLVLLEAGLPEIDGIGVTRRVIQERPEQVIILLSDTEDDDLAVQGLRAGAMGLLGKDAGLDTLPRAVDGALRGEAAVSRRLAGRVVRQLRLTAGPGAGLRPIHSPLTAREWEVLDLMCQGRTTEDMAGTFVVSSDTIRSHVKHILHKLGVKSRAEAVAVVRQMRGTGEPR